MEDEGHIQVVCRVRPKNQRELRSSKESSDSCLEVDEGNKSIKIIIKDEIKTFNYDYSAGDDVTQEEMFNKIGIPITRSCLRGYNGTILCYGQTGSGKTFTIFGPGIPDQRNIKLSTRGLVPRILEYLWSHLSNDYTYNFKCSFYEIYQEKIYDLLDQENNQSLTVREDPNLGVYVEGCTEYIVNSIEDAYQALSIGFSSRHVGETAMNRVSSRSHAIFQLIIEKTQKHYRSGIEINQTVTSRFSMVDLAGSERQKDTNATGIRLREASVINKSLTCLGKVINELVIQSQTNNNNNNNSNINNNNNSNNNNNKKKRHINYRDSKLTFLLRDSLGGNSKTILIATVSPAEICSQETLSTLYFAQRSRNICNSAKVNERISGSIPALQAEILSLRAQIERLSKSSGGFPLDNRKSLSPNHYSPKRQPLTPPRYSENVTGKENIISPNIPLSNQKNLLVEKHSQTIKLNRELEDLLENKDNVIAEKDKEIRLLQEMLEKSQCENEARQQIEEGRFSHTKILMSTIDELKKSNENLSTEVQTLRSVRDSLLQNAENEINIQRELYNQIDVLTKQKNDLESELQFTKKQLMICEDSYSELQKELSLYQHQYLDERTRAENYELSLVALKTHLKGVNQKQIQQQQPLSRTSRGSLMIAQNQLYNSQISVNDSLQIEYMNHNLDNNIIHKNNKTEEKEELEIDIEQKKEFNIENEEENENENENEEDWKTISSITEKRSETSSLSETIEIDQSPSAKTQSTFSEENIRVTKEDQSASSSTKRSRSALATDLYPSFETQEDEKQPNLLSKVLGIFSKNKRLRTESFKEPKAIPPPQPTKLNCSNIEGARSPNSCVMLTWDYGSPSSKTLKELTTFEIERSVMSYTKEKTFLQYEQVGITNQLHYILSISSFPSSVLRFRVRALCLGMKSEWSSSVTMRTPSRLIPTKLQHLEYSEPFDENGVLYWIGSNGKEREYINPYTSRDVNVTLSCKWYATDAAVYVENKPLRLIHDANYPCSWIEIDLGREKQLIPNHYCLRGFENMRKILISWELQGKREESETWTTLKTHHKDTKIFPSLQSYPVGSWSLPNIKQPYRYFRILQMDHKDKFANFLTCSGIELYGTLLQTEEEKMISSPKKSEKQTERTKHVLQSF